MSTALNPTNGDDMVAIDQKEVFSGGAPSVGGSGIDVMSWLTKAGETISPWWSTARDTDLRRFWKGNDYTSGAIHNFIARMRSIPVHVEPRDNSILSHKGLAADFQRVLNHNCESRSDPLVRGWSAVFGLWLQDYVTQDNGAFMIVEGPGRSTGPLTGRPTKLVHLDSAQCTRTGDHEFPVVYREHGKTYRLHRTRVLAASSLPSPQLGMHGVGFSATSRMVNNGQILTDQDIFLQEMMGSRPARQMIVIKKGATVQDIARAFMTAEMAMDNQGLTRYSKTVVVGPRDRSGANEMELEKIDLSSVPPGFDRADNQAKGMFVIALALGVPARWLWPATTTGATKADALYQHVVGLVTGPAEVLMVITHGLETLFLPPTLQISTDYQDDEQDRAAAEIRNTRSQSRERDLKVQVITIRVAREQMLSAGEITEAQFIQMELDEGRLRDGSDVLAVFSSTDPEIQRMVDLGIEEPLAVDAHDAISTLLAIEAAAIAATDQAASGRTPSLRMKAKQSVAGLGKLKQLYSKKAAAQAQQDLGLVQAAGPAGAQPGGGQPSQGPGPGAAGAAPKPTQGGQGGGSAGPAQEASTKGLLGRFWEAVKGYDFGVGAGQTIGGGLARDMEGQFVSADELQAKVEGEMLNRLASARLSDAERMANRAKVAAGLGLDPAALTALDSGDYGTHADALVEKGLLWRDERTGNLSTTFRGTTLLNAANRGDEAGAQLVMKPPAEEVAKGGGGTAVAKPPKEEVERENRKKVAETLSEDMEAGDLDALYQFQQGDSLDPERAARLAEDGLIEYDQEGEARMARAGRQLVKMANSGEAGEARDLLSQSREEVQDKLTQAAEMREQIKLVEVQLSKVEGTQQIKDIVQAGRLKAAIRRATRQADQIERALGKLKMKIVKKTEESVVEES